MYSDNGFDPREKQNHNWAATCLKPFMLLLKDKSQRFLVRICYTCQAQCCRAL